MQFRVPRNTAKYYWTNHIQAKMRQYGISEARVKRILRAPLRTEEGIADGTIAAMQPVSARWDAARGAKVWTQEYWLMYQVRRRRDSALPQFRLISVWRYPGVTKPGDGVPEDILAEFLSYANDDL